MMEKSEPLQGLEEKADVQSKEASASNTMHPAATAVIAGVMAVAALHANAQNAPANPLHAKLHVENKLNKKAKPFKPALRYADVSAGSSMSDGGIEIPEKERLVWRGIEGDTGSYKGPVFEEMTGDPRVFIKNNTEHFYLWLKEKKHWERFTKAQCSSSLWWVREKPTRKFT